jgi:hypothetical protein
MAFTWTGDLTVDLEWVRFETGDVDSAAAVLDDATITALITDAGSKQSAVIRALQHKWMLLANPNFRADWLIVNHKDAQAAIEKIIDDKRREYGLPASTVTATHRYRADSLHDEEPDYT